MAVEANIDPSEKERDTVVHEVGHALAKVTDEDPNLHPVTRWEENDLQGPPDIGYVEFYLRKIRDNGGKPWS